MLASSVWFRHGRFNVLGREDAISGVILIKVLIKFGQFAPGRAAWDAIVGRATVRRVALSAASEE
jgi:hypothetical protein